MFMRTYKEIKFILNWTNINISDFNFQDCVLPVLKSLLIYYVYYKLSPNSNYYRAHIL